LVEANQSHIKQYVLHHPRLPDIRYKQGRLSQTALSVPLIATMLREQGILCGSVPLSKTDVWSARFDDYLVRVHGMSRYSRDNLERVIPLWVKTGRVLRNWFRELEPKATEVAFPSVRGTPLSSDGLDYILQQAVKRATEACGGFAYTRFQSILTHA
jgi:integrase